MQAIIDYDGFSRQESDKLKPFLPFAEYFASRWQLDVVLNAPHGRPQAFETQDADEIVYIHFFSTPLRSDNPQVEPRLGYAETLLGFKLPIEDLQLSGSGFGAQISGEDVGAKWRSLDNFSTITSPEGLVVAHVVKNHIYILLNIAYKLWDGAIPIFCEILERAAAYLDIKNESSLAFSFNSKAQRKLRNAALNREDIGDNFNSLARMRLESEQKKAQQNYLKKWAEAQEKEERLEETRIQIIFLEEMITAIELGEDPDLTDSALSDEFDIIHDFAGLRGIEVHENELYIYTEPIEHASSLHPKPRTLSQFKIIIRPQKSLGESERSGNAFDSILMHEWGWKGPYYHPENPLKDKTEPHAVCFGGDLSKSMRKALILQDFRAVINLILHFLDSDNRSCYDRPRDQQSGEPYEWTQFYEDEEAREATRKAYIVFVRRFSALVRKEAFKNELSEAQKKENSISKYFMDARFEAMLLDHKRKFLRSCTDKLQPDRELEELYDLSDLISMQIGHDSIWCLFGAGAGVGQFADKWFTETFRVLIKLLPTPVIYVWYGAVKSTDEPFLKERFSAPVKGAVNFESVLKKYIARGLLGQALVLIRNVFRGESPKLDTALLIDIDDKAIARYLKQEAFRL